MGRVYFFCILMLLSSSVFSAVLIVANKKEIISVSAETLDEARKDRKLLRLNCKDEGMECKELAACEKTGWWAHIRSATSIGGACGAERRESAIDAAVVKCEENEVLGRCRPKVAAKIHGWCFSGLDTGVYGGAASNSSKKLEFTCEVKEDFQVVPKTLKESVLERAPLVPESSACKKSLGLDGGAKVIFFDASWAPPAEGARKVVEKMKRKFPNIEVDVLDVDKNKKAYLGCQKERLWKVWAIPAVVGVENNRLIDSVNGFSGKREEKKIHRLFSILNDNSEK